MPITYIKLAPKKPAETEKKPTAFQCMLAASHIPSESQIKFPALVSFKLDGIRSPQVDGVAMSRKMIPLPNKHIQTWANRWKDHLHGLDGEMIVGPPNLTTTFNTSTSGIMSADGTPDFKFYVFEHWNLGSTGAFDRFVFLQKYIHELPDEVKSRIVLLEQGTVFGLSNLKQHYAQSLNLGYEGLILKGHDHEYKFGRSSIAEGYALKWKEFVDYNCVVVGVKQGTKNTNVKKMDELGHAKRSSAKAGKVLVEELGGFIVQCIDPESVYFDMQFNCGTGSLTQATLRLLWKVRDTLPGRLLRVKSQKLGGKTLPRYPNWFGWVDPINLGTYNPDSYK